MSSPYTPGGGDVDRAVSGAHADYHREIQQHSRPDGLVDDVVTYPMLAPHLMRTLLFLVAPTVLLLVKAVIDYLASMSSPDAFVDLVSTLLGLLVVVLYLAGIASFFAPAKEPIAEHARLLENAGDAAAGAFEYVRATAEARRSPAQVRATTVAGVPVLLFSQYSERAMLLVQPYGRDLYVGWTMWRSRSTATLLVHFLRDTFGRFAPSPRFSAELRAAATRALRESVHSLSREGVTAALHLVGAPRDAGPYPPPAPHAADATGAAPGGPAWRPAPAGPPDAGNDAGNDAGRDVRHEGGYGAGHAAPHPSGALPTSGPRYDERAAWTGDDTGGWSVPRRDEERVGTRRDTPRGSKPDSNPDSHPDAARPADDDWGPPPRDRW